MYLKKLKKIICGLLTAVIAFFSVGANQAFCVGEGKYEKEVEELISYVKRGDCDSVRGWLARREARWLVTSTVTRWYQGSYWDAGLRYERSNKPDDANKETRLNVIGVMANEIMARYESGRGYQKVYENEKEIKNCIRIILNYIADLPEDSLASSWIDDIPPAEKISESRPCPDLKLWDLWLRDELRPYAEHYSDRFKVFESRELVKPSGAISKDVKDEDLGEKQWFDMTEDEKREARSRIVVKPSDETHGSVIKSVKQLEDEKQVEALIRYVEYGDIERVKKWLARPDAAELVTAPVLRWYDENGDCYSHSGDGFRKVGLNVVEVIANKSLLRYERYGERWWFGDTYSHPGIYGPDSDVSYPETALCVLKILEYIANAPKVKTTFVVTSPPPYKAREWKFWDMWLCEVFKKYVDEYPGRFKMNETREVNVGTFDKELRDEVENIAYYINRAKKHNPKFKHEF